MKITKTSIFTNRKNTMEIPMTGAEFSAAYARWGAGALIQDAYPNLTADQREFLLTGSTPEEWDKFFGEGREE